MLSYQPASRAPWVRTLLDYNPFYLLSAMCMLVGLFSLNDSLDWSPLPLFNILMLITILNLYEILLIGLGIFLLGRGLRRDAVTLFVLEGFFLVDAGFLNAEVFTQDFHVGVGANVALLILAVMKVAVIFRALRLPLASGPFTLVVTQLVVLLAMPGMFKFVSLDRFGALPALVLYAYWWIVGATVALAGVLLRRTNLTGGPALDRFGRNRSVVVTLIGLGFVSIFAHLCTSNWVYGVRWYAANLSPVMLGLAAAVVVAGSALRLKPLSRLRAAISLPIAAVLFSAAFPGALEFQPGGLLVFSPLRLALLGSAGVFILTLCAWNQPLFAIPSTGCLLAAGMGHSLSGIAQNIASIGDMFVEAVRSVLPQSAAHWGVTSVVVAFVLLAAGVGLSLLRARIEEAELKRYLDQTCDTAGVRAGTQIAAPRSM
jgi:hypothetical protein